MKLARIAVVFSLFSTAALAQDPGKKPPPQSRPAAPAPDPNAVRAAEMMLGDIAKAYKSAKTLTVVIKREIPTPDEPQVDVMTIAFGPGNDASM